MTPLETELRFPEYTIPGEYFSPLTSPALEAQASNPTVASQFQHVNQLPETGGFLPSSASVDAHAPSSPGITRKHRRWPSATSSRTTHRRGVKPSPSTRPQSRKKPVLNVNSQDVINGLYQEGKEANMGTPTSAGISSAAGGFHPGGNDGSSQDSVSPEPLSEPLMPPPALPQPRTSPAMGPQHKGAQASEAATPATLMRIQRSHSRDPTSQFSGQAQLAQLDDVMEDVVLPEAAAAPTTALRSTDRHHRHQRDAVVSPTISANATPSLEPNKGPGSIAPSPSVSTAVSSPAFPPSGSRRRDSKGSSRKRQSVSSSQMSPPLQPKISPNIQPMLRADGISLFFAIAISFLVFEG